MASIVDRWKNSKTKRPLRWQVKWRKPDGTWDSDSYRLLDDAKARKAEVETDIRTGAYIDPKKGEITFGAFAETVLDDIVIPLRPTSEARLRASYRSRILPYWHDVRIGAINHGAVQAWITSMKHEIAPATVLKTFQHFHKVITAAIDAKILTEEPWGKLHFPPIKRHKARFLEPAEVDRLADAIGTELRAFVYVGAVCGLRAGEMFGLRWSAVDFDKRTIEVSEIVAEGADGKQYEGEPKTDAGFRRVPMPSVVIDELELHRLTASDPNGLVFPDAGGGARRATNFRNRVWKPACARAGLDGLVIHELRHSAVAGWIASGAEPKEVADRAGHRSIVTIYDRYGHLFASSASRLNDSIDALYRAARETAES